MYVGRVPDAGSDDAKAEAAREGEGGIRASPDDAFGIGGESPESSRYGRRRASQ